MTLKRITLHRAAADNLGNFVDAGSELTVGDHAKAGHITADRAAEIVASHGAKGHHADTPTAKRAPKKARKVATKAAAPAPAPVVPAPVVPVEEQKPA